MRSSVILSVPSECDTQAARSGPMKAIILLAALTSVLSAGTIYSITGLGSLGGSSAVGYKINNSGTVAGWAQTASGDQHGFLANGAGIQDLSPLFGSDTFANGINTSGVIVGTSYVNGQAHGTVWAGSGSTDLGAGSFAIGINDADVIIGGNGHAFVLANGAYQDLGVLQVGGWSSASGINQSGTVVGDASVGSGFHGFIWTAGTGMLPVGDLGGGTSHATGINNDGAVVGTATLASGYEHAFLAIGAKITDLGTLGGGSSFAYSINESGAVVGYSWLTSGQHPHAFVYSNGIMLDLNSLLASGSGWELTEAYGINDAGQIVGSGLFNGQVSAFRLDPTSAAIQGASAVPEAGTTMLVAIGLGLLIIARGQHVILKLLPQRALVKFSNAGLGHGLQKHDVVRQPPLGYTLREKL
jgi:probable HAF family extracellular repeat protein